MLTFAWARWEISGDEVDTKYFATGVVGNEWAWYSLCRKFNRSGGMSSSCLRFDVVNGDFNSKISSAKAQIRHQEEREPEL